MVKICLFLMVLLFTAQTATSFALFDATRFSDKYTVAIFTAMQLASLGVVCWSAWKLYRRLN